MGACRAVLLSNEFAAIHVHPAGEFVLARFVRCHLDCDGLALRQVRAFPEARDDDLLAASGCLAAREVQPDPLSCLDHYRCGLIPALHSDVNFLHAALLCLRFDALAFPQPEVPDDPSDDSKSDQGHDNLYEYACDEL